MDASQAKGDTERRECDAKLRASESKREPCLKILELLHLQTVQQLNGSLGFLTLNQPNASPINVLRDPCMAPLLLTGKWALESLGKNGP